MKTYKTGKEETSVSVPQNRSKKKTPYGEDISQEMIDLIKDENYTIVGLDPGKKDLATVSAVDEEVLLCLRHFVIECFLAVLAKVPGTA